ncbi:MAG: hypothetical protein HF314_07715 [Ignavibacteria bacterium]|jgi:hypothetical protein|nr:hypothetical protein [Ignavibacteria bacterium]MCU7502944.1 hypothetical protein [Ignavibacteria bacterium]MCU7517073.1 hypothetical protein [Ignavibacteria bacterium]
MNIFVRPSIIFPIIVLSFFSGETSLAQEKVQFSGYGAAGYKFYDRNILRQYNQEVYYEGKLQADIKINRHLDAQLDMRGSSEDERLLLREFSVKFDYLKYLKFKVGNIKKPFGLEQLVNTEELLTVERSYIQRSISDIGYGGRSVSLMAYYKFNKKRSEFPFSYSLALMKDNSLNTSLAGRFSFHDEALIYSLNYLYQRLGGEYPERANGFSADLVYEGELLKSSFEVQYVEDPIESQRLKLSGEGRNVYVCGIKSINAFSINPDGEVIKTIEPVLLAGMYFPDSREKNTHTFEIIAGGNIYLDKDLRLRLNGDLLLSKDRYNSSYSTTDSKLVFECQVTF